MAKSNKVQLKVWHIALMIVGVAMVVLCLLISCHKLPKTPHLSKSIALSEQAQTRQHNITANIATSPIASNSQHLATIIKQTDSHPDLSGYYPIATGVNAFAARSILSTMATNTIDVQYYIWHDDEAGKMLLHDLWQAAERGVIVRLLLDDNDSSPSRDKLLIKLAKHPNIAIRLTNPAVYRQYAALNFITRPTYMNRRMHNKSITFDNRISIIGGRNIGDEYLNNAQANQFADLDVLLVGAVVPHISASFDDFWHSNHAFDVETLIKTTTDGDFISHLHTLNQNPSDNNVLPNNPSKQHTINSYQQAVAQSTLSQDLLNGRVPFRWVMIDVYSDPADKLSGTADPNSLLVAQLKNQIAPKNSLSIISSYFVPTQKGVDTLVALAQSGVKIKILTNSYDATDVGIVHAGYAHWRRKLLQAGIELYELKSTAKRTGLMNLKLAKKSNKLWRTYGQTTTSLHAKAFAVDDYQVFIGSYNIDPRSANINSEMGVIIEDELLAQYIHNALGESLLSQAYKLSLHNNQIRWQTLENGKLISYDNEPNMQTTDRMMIGLLSLLPIDFLL